MPQYTLTINSAALVISANIVSSATIINSANRVLSATSTTMDIGSTEEIQGAAYVKVLSQQEFNSLVKDPNTFYFVLDNDQSSILVSCDTSLFLHDMRQILGSSGQAPLIYTTNAVYKCTSVDTTTNTWTGQRSIQTLNGILFLTLNTTGLLYRYHIIPEVGNVYPADCAYRVVDYQELTDATTEYTSSYTTSLSALNTDILSEG